MKQRVRMRTIVKRSLQRRNAVADVHQMDLLRRGRLSASVPQLPRRSH